MPPASSPAVADCALRGQRAQMTVKPSAAVMELPFLLNSAIVQPARSATKGQPAAQHVLLGSTVGQVEVQGAIRAPQDSIAHLDAPKSPRTTYAVEPTTLVRWHRLIARMVR